MERIWYQDLPHVFSQQHYLNFFPSKEMTFAEQLNSLMRLSLYFSIILFLLKGDPNVFMFPIFMGLFTFFLYSVDTQNKVKEKMYLEDQGLYKQPHSKEICQKPTEDNPFMNVLISDYTSNPQRKKACNVTKGNIKKQATSYFDKKLYRSASDVFHKEASDRQWITNPSTEIPNDREKWLEWCYGSKQTCKEGNGNKCYANTFRHVSN